MKENKNWKAERLQARAQRKAAFMERFHHMKPSPTPYFQFTNIPDTERLTFEQVDESNYLEIYDLFRDDPNPYVIDEYKDLNKLEKYTDYQLYWNRNAVKKAACDWLIKLKASKETIGILNIHELTRETFNDNHKKGFIGYSIGQQYRRKYYATEATKKLIEYARHQHDLNKLVANVKKENIASRDLLLKLGFVDCTEDYYYSDVYDYYMLI